MTQATNNRHFREFTLLPTEEYKALVDVKQQKGGGPRHVELAKHLLSQTTGSNPEALKVAETLGKLIELKQAVEKGRIDMITLREKGFTYPSIISKINTYVNLYGKDILGSSLPAGVRSANEQIARKIDATREAVLQNASSEKKDLEEEDMNKDTSWWWSKNDPQLLKKLRHVLDLPTNDFNKELLYMKHEFSTKVDARKAIKALHKLQTDHEEPITQEKLERLKAAEKLFLQELVPDHDNCHSDRCSLQKMRETLQSYYPHQLPLDLKQIRYNDENQYFTDKTLNYLMNYLAQEQGFLRADRNKDLPALKSFVEAHGGPAWRVPLALTHDIHDSEGEDIADSHAEDAIARIQKDAKKEEEKRKAVVQRWRAGKLIKDNKKYLARPFFVEERKRKRIKTELK